VIGGAGPGGAPRVLALSGRGLVTTGTQTTLANWFAGSTALRGGGRVAAKDLDGDGLADLVTGSGDTQDVFAFLGKKVTAGDTTAAWSAHPFPDVAGGVFVG
jgi:hypothetical protein